LKSPNHSIWHWSNGPLLVAYVAYPISEIWLQLIGVDISSVAWSRLWIDMVWLIFSIIALAILLFRLPGRLQLRKEFRVLAIIVPLCIVLAMVSLLSKGIEPSPFFMELKPFIYGVVALVWAKAFGLPTETSFVRAGSLLSGLIIGELLVRSVLTQGVVHPLGSGEINYDACLIVLSLCVSLSHKSPRAQLLWLFLGVLATFSRTGAIAAVCVLFTSPRVERHYKLLACLPAALAIFLSFQSRGLEFDVSKIDRYLMWQTAITLFSDHPTGLPFGYAVGCRLPVDIPIGLRDLWASQADKIGTDGVFAFQFHAMWLRILISWGAVALCCILLVLISWMLQRRSLLARYVATATLAEGFSMGMFYLSNVGVPAFLAIGIALNSLHYQTGQLPSRQEPLNDQGYQRVLPQDLSPVNH
jgi:hypothetical protein